MTNYVKAKTFEVEDEKNAPKWKDGPKYKVRSGLPVLCFDIP